MVKNMTKTTKKTTYKFKNDLMSNGTVLSDGHFLAPIDHPAITWKCPNDQTTAALIKRETFWYRYKKIEMNECPDFQAILNMEKEAVHTVTDTCLTIAENGMSVRLYWSEGTGLIGIDEQYYFLLESQAVRAKDNVSPLFAGGDVVVMPVTLSLDKTKIAKYFS